MTEQPTTSDAMETPEVRAMRRRREGAALLTPRYIVETRADTSITEAASFAAEGARIVCHIELNHIGTIYGVIPAFYQAAFSMETAAENMRYDLVRMLAEGRLNSTQHGLTAAFVEVENARRALLLAQEHAKNLGAALQTAQNAVASLYHPEPETDED